MIRLLTHPLFWVITLMPFGWVESVQLGGFSVNLPYIAALALIGVAAITPAYYFGATAILRHYGIWLAAYALYLPLLIVSLAGSEAQGMPFRQIFFSVTALACAAWIAVDHDRSRLLRSAAACGILLTVIVIEVLARRVGLSWLDAILRFITSGDLDFIIYGFFRRVFNAAGGEDAAAVGAAAKNALASAVFTAGVLFRAGHQTNGRDRIGVILSLLILGLLIMLNTRSVLLMALLSFPLAGIISLTRRGQISLARSVGAILITAIAVTGLVLFATSDNALMSTLADRFSFTDASAGSRFDQLGWAFGRIETAIWTGSGYAEIDGHPVHNLFVGAWMHAGLFAFILVTFFYIGLLITWARFVAQILMRPAAWTLPLKPEWVAVLPLVPLFRVWLSGDAGHMNFVEWIAISAFLGVLAANRLAQPALQTPGLRTVQI